jgi:hypothetical protein
MNENLRANINLTAWPFGIEKREYYTPTDNNNSDINTENMKLFKLTNKVQLKQPNLLTAVIILFILTLSFGKNAMAQEKILYH